MPITQHPGSLEERVAALEYKLANVVASSDAITVTGANLWVVNGTGTTDGLGNVIVGYNERRPLAGAANVRSGSHVIVVGKANNFSQFGGVIVGYANDISGDWASVTAGEGNTANGMGSSVSGGTFNGAIGPYSSVSGGAGNGAAGDTSSVCGGFKNRAGGDYSVILAGSGSIADGESSSVGGGIGHRANAYGSSISGGQCVFRRLCVFAAARSGGRSSARSVEHSGANSLSITSSEGICDQVTLRVRKRTC